jgi:hypothetical protein
MTVFERLVAAADAETWELVRRMIPKRELALYMARTITTDIGANVNVDAVAEIFGINKQSAYNKIGKLNSLK